MDNFQLMVVDHCDIPRNVEYATFHMRLSHICISIDDPINRNVCRSVEAHMGFTAVAETKERMYTFLRTPPE